MNKEKGFTLLEMIAVIAIIGLLVGILVPALTGAKASALKASCASNLKQCANCFYMYHEKYQGWLPWPKGWYSALVSDGFLSDETIAQCPAYSRYGSPFNNEYSYKMNGALVAHPDSGPGTPLQDYYPRLSRVRQYVRARYAAGLRRQISNKTIALLIDGVPNNNPIISSRNNLDDIANRHADGTNVVFCDGSVKYVPAGSMNIIKNDENGWLSGKEAQTGVFWGK